ncbi:MazG-like family protein [Streptomyces sp. NPDC016309]|uniref:MazG-like family protein n=1 Tax=Streptomyces sp. NPDC016309 TaxID=3364965 RepID=UPI0037033726
MDDRTWHDVRRLRAWLDAEAAPSTAADARLLRVIKVSEELGEVAEAVHGALGANPRKGASHTWEDVARELADVIVTAMVALDTISGEGIAVLTSRFTARAEANAGRAAADGASAGDPRLLRLLGISRDMGGVAVTVLGALGANPRGDASGTTSTWDDAMRGLGDLVVAAMEALDSVNGAAQETVDGRLRFLVARALGAVPAAEETADGAPPQRIGP